MLTPLVLTDQIIGDNFGFNLKFPYDPSGFRVALTLKKAPDQAAADADAAAAGWVAQGARVAAAARAKLWRRLI